MADTIRISFARMCLAGRTRLGISQSELGRAAGVTGAYVSMIEAGRANPTAAVIERIAKALGVELSLEGRAPIVLDTRQRDLVHAWCSAYVDRRLTKAGLVCRREVEIVDGRAHGWIDLIGFDGATGTLLVIEIKTRIDDVGAVERQLAWYVRQAEAVARREGWAVRRVRAWLLVLASGEAEAAIRTSRGVLRVAFPDRAVAMRADLTEPLALPVAGERSLIREAARRGLAMIDPASRRREWLMSTGVDGRRGPAPYRDYAAAAAKLRSE